MQSSLDNNALVNIEKIKGVTCNDSVFLNALCTYCEGSQNETATKSDSQKKNSNSIQVQKKISENSITNTQTCSLSLWSLPDGILQKYKSRGLTHMFDWQVECLSNPKVLLENKNLVYSAPTSAGKTLIAEILSIKTVLERRKKVIIILPFVSVVREKMYYFQDILSSTDARVEGFMGAHNPPGGFKTVNLAICTIEKANSIVNKLLEEGKLNDVGAVVIDEMHLLGDPSRGYLLELLLTKLRYMSAKCDDITIQLIGMSATLPNLDLLAKWLDAELYTTNFRPIPLYEYCLVNREIYNTELKLERRLEAVPELKDDTDNILQICLETISTSCSVLIFCPTKNWCENLAQQIAAAIWKLGRTDSQYGQCLREQINFNLITETLEQLKRCPVGLDSVLKKTVSFGVAFHHAGLTMDERDIIEGAFRNSALRILVATSTLSSGVNLPARRVIIRTPLFHGRALDSLTYRQMIGRAGRMGKDSAGESILICQKNDRQIAATLMSAELQPIESCLEGAGKLKRAILEVIASNVASSVEDVNLFARSTLLATAESEFNDEKDPVGKAVSFLEENEFIRLQKDENEQLHYVPTSLAKACLSSSLPPEDGLALFEELEKARRCFVLDTELHLLYLVTPYSVCNQWSNLDWMLFLEMWEKLPASDKRVADLVGVKESFIFNSTRGKINTNTSKMYHRLQIHRRFYTALALHDLVNEVPLNDVAAKFQCSRGMLQSLQQSAATFAGMVTSFSRQLGWTCVELLVSQFQDRLEFGIQHELLDLMKLPLLNGPRARTLYNANIKTLIDLAGTDVCKLENILYSAVPFQSEKEREGETEFDVKQKKDLRTFWITGKKGLTAREAAVILIEDARKYLQYEVGAKVKWDSANSDEDDNMSSTSQSSMSTSDTLSTSNMSSDSSDTSVSDDKMTCTNIEPDKTDYKFETNDTEHRNVYLCTEESEEMINKINFNNCKEDNTTKNTVSDNKTIYLVTNDNAPATNASLENDIAIEYAKDIIEHKEYHSENIMQQNENSFFNDSFENDFNYNSVNQNFTNKIMAIENNITKQENESGKSILIEDIDSPKDDKILSLTSDIIHENFKTDIDDNDHNWTPFVSLAIEGLPESENNFFQNSFENINDKCNSQSQLNKNLLNASNESDSLFEDSICLDSKICHVLDTSNEKCQNKKSNVEYNEQFTQISSICLDSKICEVLDNSFENTQELVLDIMSEDNVKEEINKENNNMNCINLSGDIFLTNSFEENKENGNIEMAERSLFENAFASSFNLNPNTSDKNSEIISASLKTDNLNIIETSQIENLSDSHLRHSSCHNIKNNSHNTGTKRRKEENDDKNLKQFETPNKRRKNNRNTKKLDITYACSDKAAFADFSARIRRQNDISLAVGCKSYVQNKNQIGAKILKESGSKKESDNETSEFILGNREICGISTFWGEKIYYLSFSNHAVNTKDKIELLQEIFTCNNTVLRIYDAKEQVKILSQICERKIRCHLRDPTIADWLLETEDTEKNFLTMASTYTPELLNFMKQIPEYPRKSSIALSYNSSTPSDVRACIESLVTWNTINVQLNLLEEEDKRLLDVFDVEMNVVSTLTQMELNGVHVNVPKINNLVLILQQQMAIIEKEAYRLAGRSFSFTSSKDVAKVLGINKGKKVSTNKQVLEQIDNPLSNLIIQWRKLDCILSKMLFPIMRNIKGDCIYGCCITRTATGRISMHEPSLQSIPKNFDIVHLDNTVVPISMRACFVPSRGKTFISADYCQLELRILAHLSQDIVLCKTMKSGEDIFKSIAAKVYKVPVKQIPDDLRQRAKQVCYGIIYGMGSKTLSDQLQSSESEAKEFMDSFINTYPSVKRFIQRTINHCREKGYIETLSGRRRYLPYINHQRTVLKSQAERQAVNTTVQGSAADLVKRAMLLVEAKLKEHFKNNNPATLVLHIHDELLYEINTKDMKAVAKIIKNAMENVMKLSVPFPVKLKSGGSWGELIEFVI